MNTAKNNCKVAKSGNRIYEVPGLGIMDLLILKAERLLRRRPDRAPPPALLAGLWEICAFAMLPSVIYRIDLAGRVIAECLESDPKRVFGLHGYLRAYVGRLCPVSRTLLQRHLVSSEVTGQELDLRTATPGEISLFLHREQGGDFWEQEGTINKRIAWLASIADDCFDAYFRTQLRAVVYRSAEHPDWIEVVSASSVPQDAGTAEGRQTVRSYNVIHPCDSRGLEAVVARHVEGINKILPPYGVKVLDCDADEILLSVVAPGRPPLVLRCLTGRPPKSPDVSDC